MFNKLFLKSPPERFGNYPALVFISSVLSREAWFVVSSSKGMKKLTE